MAESKTAWVNAASRELLLSASLSASNFGEFKRLPVRDIAGLV